MLLELCVNGNCYGAAFVVLEQEHEHERVLVDAESLSRAHLTLRAEAAQTIDGKPFYDVHLLAEGVQAEVKADAGRLVLTVPPQAFGGSRIDLNAAPRALTAGAVPSAYVNYGVSAGTMHENSVYLDAGFAVGRGLARDNPSWNDTTGFSRGLSRFEYDEPGTLARWTIGDQVASSSDGLGGSALLGGIGIARAFDLDPYLITYPQPVISGVLQAPGTIDIYENGVLVGQRQVPAGPFSLASLGLAAGANNVRVVVQDPFGGTTVLQQSYYGANQLLAPGLSDYAYEIGIERASTLANGYIGGQGVLLARDSYGFSDRITAGVRLEAENGLVNAGPSMSVRLPAGVLSAGVAGSHAGGHADAGTYADGGIYAVAGSHADAGGGYGTSLSYQYNSRNFSAGAATQIFSSDYLRIGDELLSPAERTRRVSTLNAAWLPTAHVSFQLSAGDTHFDDGSRQRNEGVSSEIDLVGGARITVSFNHQVNFPGPNDNQFMVTFAMPLAWGSFGVDGSHDQASGNSYGFFAQRSVPVNTGFGYNVNVQSTSLGSTGLGQLAYQGQYGLAQLTAQRIGGETAESLLLSGSLVALDGHVYAGRALQNGYALVETPGLSNVEIMSQNQAIGKTDGNGNLIVYNLLPYQINKVGVDQATVPLEYQIDAIDELVSVPRLGGTIVRFDLHPLHAARGVLMLDGKAVKYGTATVLVEDQPTRTLIGLDGSFYFSDLPGGKYVLKAQTTGGTLSCPVRVPATSSPVLDLGQIRCSSEPQVPR
jgi:outer membrane usher protein